MRIHMNACARALLEYTLVLLAIAGHYRQQRLSFNGTPECRRIFIFSFGLSQTISTGIILGQKLKIEKIWYITYRTEIKIHAKEYLIT